jgi:hypothetical protein
MENGSSPGHGSPYVLLKDKALLALLTADSLASAARHVGVDEDTLRSWCARPDFVADLARLRGLVIGQAVNKLASAAAEAVDLLVVFMRDLAAGPATRVKAATTVLNLILRVAEAEQERDSSQARIDRLIREAEAEMMETMQEVNIVRERIRRLRGPESADGAADVGGTGDGR